MPHRAPSPAVSENEVDISHSLFHDGPSSSSDNEGQLQHPDRKARMLGPGDMPDLDGDFSSDDAGFIAETQAASNRKASNAKGKSIKGGKFQAMGLSVTSLKAITRKGFVVPTPIQRKTIPLVLDGKDVVGMARTGSGKTGAFVIPMIEKLKSHSAKVGARALIMSPSRELALQTLKVVKELGKGTDLKCVLLVGGDSLEEQFSHVSCLKIPTEQATLTQVPLYSFMSTNPDVVIATPGRFLHLKVEMGLDLSSINYVVFDEADRLFELGFAAQLTEILYALPQSRQTLLFSATLPASLIEFARAGLQEPNLVRLDAESKISPDLQSAFFTMKSAEKEGALMQILNDIIKIPTGQTEATIRAKEEASKNSKKRKRGEIDGAKPHESPTEHSTIIFAATKHHVDYLAALLRQSGFAVSHAYGSLDQTARKMQVQDFRTGMTNILVVTDVAARGIDIPILANVINYDFPAQPKIFVHRVGRTARAGKKGWSYSLVRESDAPYLLDLQLFLGRRLVLGQDGAGGTNFAEDVVVGGLGRDRLERNCEWVSKLLDEDSDLLALRSVANKGEKLYLKTRNAASSESARRAKEATASRSWMALHPLFQNDMNYAELERAKMLARVSGFRPQETVFEIGKRGIMSEAAEVMKKRRMTVDKQRRKKDALQQAELEVSAQETIPDTTVEKLYDPDESEPPELNAEMDSASEDELEVTLTQPEPTKGDRNKAGGYKDPTFYMGYTPTSINLAEDRGYGVHSGGNSNNFVLAARDVAMDLAADEGAKGFAQPSRPSGMRWDKKSKKYVARSNDEDGSKGARMIRGESGQKIAASFRSGRFDAWRKSNKIDRLPRTGEAETASNRLNGGGGGGKRWKHKREDAPKDADKYRDDFYKRKKMVDKAKEERRGRFREGKGKNEIKGVDDVRKERGMKERRKEKNARPGKRR